MSVTTKKVWRDLISKKLRTFLVVFSVAIGVIGISMVLGTGSQLRNQMKANYLNAQPADMTAFTGYISAESLTEFSAFDNVAAVEGALVFNTRWQQNDKWEPLVLEASPNLAQRALDLVKITAGAAPGSNEILIERTTLELFDLAEGDVVTIQSPTGEKSLTISGFGTSQSYPPANFSKTGVGFISLESAEALTGQTGFNVLRIKVDEINRVALTEAAVKAQLKQDSVPLLASSLRDPDTFPGQDSINSLFTMMGAMGALALVLSGFLVVNTIVTVLASEMKQIGTMKAVGATRWQVMRLYLMLVVGYGLLASLIGVVLGTIGSNLFTRYIGNLTNLDVNDIYISLPAVAIGLVVGMLLPILAAFGPVWSGTRVTVREAITDYGISAETGLFERTLSRIQWLPFVVSLGLRNTFRNKKRALLTLITLAVAGASFMTVQATSASLNRTVDVLTETYVADLLIELDLPVPVEQIVDVIPEEFEYSAVETWLDGSAVIADVDVTLNGSPVDTAVYNRDKLIDGRWFDAGETDVIILQETFALGEGIAVGDMVSAEVGSDSASWEVIGIVRDYNESGKAPLVPYDQLANMIGLSEHVNFLIIRTESRQDSEISAISEQLDTALPTLGVQGSIYSMQDIRDQAQAGFQVIVLFLLGMAVLIAFVGGLGLFGTLTINVTERQKEIGIMRSVGATNGDVVRIFWLEGICLGVVSWLAAILIGYPLARSFTNLLSDALIPVEFYLPSVSVLLLGVVMLLLVSVASIMPALSASRSRVSDIIRY